MIHNFLSTVAVLSLLMFAPVNAFAERGDAFVGNWALTIPGGGAGWLGVQKQGDQFEASLLWGGGSVVPVKSIELDGDTLKIVRAGRRNTDRRTEEIHATVSGDDLTLELLVRTANARNSKSETFSGTRILPLPPRPNTAKIKYGKPLTLLNESDLKGWSLTKPTQANGWSVSHGVLANNTEQPEDGPKKAYGNLRTDDLFEDFRLQFDVLVPEHGNSGVYLRGIYEIQVSDSYGRPLDSHNMGAIYSRITPAVNAEKPAGEWQTFDVILLDRHVTVVLNGKTIIDNEPLLGCTGGALTSDQFSPGPIYLQGDHGPVSYRNVILTPIKK